MRRTTLFALAGFLVPTIVAILILGAEQDGGPDLDTFENANFPFKFSYPDRLDAGSTDADVPVLTLGGPNLITVRRVGERVPASGLSAFVAQLLVDQVQTSRVERHSGREMVRTIVPRTDAAAESLVFFFTGPGGTYEVDCQYTNDRRRQMIKACRRAVNTLDFS